MSFLVYIYNKKKSKFQLRLEEAMKANNDKTKGKRK